MLAAMTAEANREAAREGEAEENSPVEEAPRGRGMLRHWRSPMSPSTALRAMLPLASAAALTLAWGFAGKQPVTRGVPDVMQGGFANDEALRELVDVHKRPIRPETKDVAAVRGFEPDVGVPVRAVRFKQGNARFVGARIVNMQGAERSAVLYYEVPQANGGVNFELPSVLNGTAPSEVTVPVEARNAADGSLWTKHEHAAFYQHAGHWYP